MDELLRHWRRIPTEWEPGLSERELLAAERRFSFEFPPDLRAVLIDRLPVGEGFANWRDLESVTKPIEWPWEGMRFDIEQDAFWHRDWGLRPAGLDDALAIARSHYDASPKLIPVYGHRYLPCAPNESGNPVFSVWQTDIIYYGVDLADWIRSEFSAEGWSIDENATIKHIPLWTSIAECDCE